MKSTISAKGTEIAVISKGKEDDYISLTDIARYKNPDEPKDVVKNWLRSRSTIEFLGLWEQINNPDFKGVEFDSFKQEAGANAFTLSPQKWIESTNVVLSNLESMNAELIKRNVPQGERLLVLNKMAIEQMTSILGCSAVKELGVER